jgi:hypothetical protein
MNRASSISVGVGIGALLVLGSIAMLGVLPNLSSRNTAFETTTATKTITTTSQFAILTTITTTKIATTPVNSNSPTLSYALMTTSRHLLLRLTLANSSILIGKNVSLGLSLTNMLTTTNDIPSGRTSAIAGLYWPGDICSTADYNEPLGIAIFKGSFSNGNISSGTPLFLLNPQTHSCPSPPQVSTWSFRPMSAVANDVLLNANFSTNGYWSGADAYGNGAIFVHFNPGHYTVAIGDEWGDLLLLEFEVT